MGLGISIYLDFIRLLAALSVVLCHAAWLWTPGHFAFFLKYGQSAVLVFFVLSGFVIAYVTKNKENTAASYFINRAARMYSVVLPALILTFLLDALGKHFSPDLYYASWGYTDKNQVQQFFRALLFLNEVWGSHSVPGSNNPFWSLGYEVPYYLIYGIWLFVPRGFKIAGACLILAFFGPRVASLFPVWLMGVFAYRYGTRLNLSAVSALLLCVVSIEALVVWELVAADMDLPIAGLLFRHHEFWALFGDYFVGLCIALHIIAAWRLLDAWVNIIPSIIQHSIRWAAGASFTVYLLHFPLGLCMSALLPVRSLGLGASLIFIVILLALLAAIAKVTERKKNLWRKFFIDLITKVRMPLLQFEKVPAA